MEMEKMIIPGGMERLRTSSDRRISCPRRREVKRVNADWLADHLHDTDLTIIDVQPNVHDFGSRAHPGAVYLTRSPAGLKSRLPDAIQPHRVPSVVSARGHRG